MSDLASLRKIIEFIKADLDGCIKCGVNISLALLLSTYTEFFGHLLTGSKKSRKSYDEWLRYMGQPYTELLDRGVKLYDRIRCGLIHEFTIKKGARIFIEEGYPGIEIKNDVIHFNNWQYHQDFVKSIEKYLGDIKTNTTLKKNFDNFRKGKPIVI